MKIFLDDERETPQGWHRVTTAQEAIDTIQKNWAVVTHVSLDHDLGDLMTHPEVGCGYDVVCWIEAFLVDNDVDNMPMITVHSANPAGRLRMFQGIDSCYRIFNEKTRYVDHVNKTQPIV